MKYIRGNIQHKSQVAEIGVSNQYGYVLVVAMLALCLLSLMGIWALSTSDFEFKIASNLQTHESNFNIAEGAARQEAAGVGFARAGNYEWYQISDPEDLGQFLRPPTLAEYDPGGDITISGTFPADFNNQIYETWPRQNLLKDAADDQYDYSYLVTYLYPGNPPQGYSAADFTGYRFRISAHQKAFVELGGIKLGRQIMGN